MIKKIIWLCFVMLCLACQAEEETLIGTCNEPVELSQKKVKFSSEKNSVTITANKTDWWFSKISLDKKIIDVEERQQGNLKIEEDIFSIDMTKPTEFIVTMKENETEKDRILSIVIQLRNCFSYLSITQSAKNRGVLE